MNQFKNFCRLFVLMVVFTLVTPSVLPVNSIAVAEAAVIKLSKKEITLETGKSLTLKITGTKQKVTWSSNKKAIAAVNSTGKVTAKKAGTAIITATVNKKKYTCKVTVNAAKASNPFITNAPFDAKELKFNKVSYIIPKEWIKDVLAEQGNNTLLSIHPKIDDLTKGSSSISFVINQTDQPKTDSSTLKNTITEDFIKQKLTLSDASAVLTKFKQSDYEAALGTALKTEYNITFNGIAMKQIIYDLIIDNYLLEVTVTDIGDGVSPDVNIAGEYLLNTISIGK